MTPLISSFFVSGRTRMKCLNLAARWVWAPVLALATALPLAAQTKPSPGFNDDDQEWHYALSWMAVDYIAATYGEGRVWELMDAMHNGGSGTPDADQDRVLDQVLGYGSFELAQRAAARIRHIYG